MITVKEEFLTEEKTRLAIKKGGCEAIVMWLAIKGYVARKNSNGFVPDEAIDELPGAPKNPRKALASLVDCGLRKEDGTPGCGLVDKVAFGWRLHDYEDHGTIKEVEDERRRKAREQKANRRAELARLAALREESERRNRTTLGHGADNVRGQRRTEPTDNGPDAPRPPAYTSAPARAPSPAQPSPEDPKAAAADPKDLKACGAEPPPAEKPAAAAAAAPKPVISPKNQAEAEAVAICPRSLWLRENPHMAQFVMPQAWPEVTAVAAALAEATGKPGFEQLGWYESDGGVRRVVELYAQGYTRAALVDAVRAIAKTAWWNEPGKSRGLTSLSVEVLRRHMTGATGGPAPRRVGPPQEDHGKTGWEESA